jgi:hypothetical protein
MNVNRCQVVASEKEMVCALRLFDSVHGRRFRAVDPALLDDVPRILPLTGRAKDEDDLVILKALKREKRN